MTRLCSQKEIIKKHLISGEKINPLMALNSYGCQRLAARIGEIIKYDHWVVTGDIKVNKKTKARYKEYYLDPAWLQTEEAKKIKKMMLKEAE